MTMYVCIEIYTLQLYIIDLTQRGCHTLRTLFLNYCKKQYCSYVKTWRHAILNLKNE